MSRLTRDGTAELVSRDQIIRRERGQGNIHFPCSAGHVQDWQPYPIDPYSAIIIYYVCDDPTWHTCTYIPTFPRRDDSVERRRLLRYSSILFCLVFLRAWTNRATLLYSARSTFRSGTSATWFENTSPVRYGRYIRGPPMNGEWCCKRHAALPTKRRLPCSFLLLIFNMYHEVRSLCRPRRPCFKAEIDGFI